ncbi:MAG: potassium-transporting ATPase subunit KdpC [Acidobacteriaceae bacterium]
MKKILITSVLYTTVTAILLGLGYPLLILGLGHLFFPHQVDGSLITRNGQVIGSSLIGQSFTGNAYFHSRPSAAGNGYDPTASGGSNLGPTSAALIARINASVAAEKIGEMPVPVDLVTASGSGLDPDISPAAAYYQAPRVALARHLQLSVVNQLIENHTTQRLFGLIGEPRINVLELNLALNALSPQ